MLLYWYNKVELIHGSWIRFIAPTVNLHNCQATYNQSDGDDQQNILYRLFESIIWHYRIAFIARTLINLVMIQVRHHSLDVVPTDRLHIVPHLSTNQMDQKPKGIHICLSYVSLLLLFLFISILMVWIIWPNESPQGFSHMYPGTYGTCLPDKQTDLAKPFEKRRGAYGKPF